MDLYFYEGPVKEFSNVIARHWVAYTYAKSEKKARCNMAYQFKKKTNRSVHSKIILPGKVSVISGFDDGQQITFRELFPELFD